MSDLVWPSNIPVASCSWATDDFTASDSSAVTGALQTSEIFGTRRQRVTFTMSNLARSNGTLRAFRALIARLQGARNRIWLWDPTYVALGSLSTPELILNNEFDSGISGFTGAASASLSSVDGAMRATRTTSTTGYGAGKAGIAGVQYVSYALRVATLAGRGAALHRVVMSDGIGFPTDASDVPGLFVTSITALSTSLSFSVYENSAAGLAGEYFDTTYSSLSRCAIADGGSNMLTYSDQMNQAGSWTVSAVSVTGNAAVAPDGSSTADAIIETTATSAHYIYQNVVVPAGPYEYSFGCALKIGAVRTWASLAIVELTGNHSAFAYFDLGTGLVGTTGASGANMTHARASITPLGGGWWYCSIVARKANSATALQVQILSALADNTASFTGDAGAYLYAWRATLAQSSLPTRLSLSVAAAVLSENQLSTGIYIKGLPPNGSGLARAGNQVQIGRSHRTVTAMLDSDAAGLGYLQLSEPIPGGVIDNTPVIFNRPMGRFVLAQSQYGVELQPGVFGGASLDFIEAP